MYLYRCALNVFFVCIGVYLCSRCVFDSVRVVVVVDDVIVQYGGALLGRGEGDVQRSFTGTLREHREVCGFTRLHPWRDGEKVRDKDRETRREG